MENLIKPIASQLKINETQVVNTLELLAQGSTVPFIARYRKEMTKGLDEEQILFIQKEYEYQENLKKRKEDVLRIIETQGKMTESIRNDVLACEKLAHVEDIYRPYQQKKKTRATEAIAHGLEPLANWIKSCPKEGSVESEARKYLSDLILKEEDAIKGAMDIIAEIISDDAKLRWKSQESIFQRGKIITKEKKKHEDENKVYRMYYDFQEKISLIASHRVMAIDRAEKEKVISVTLDYDKDYLMEYAIKKITRGRSTICIDQITNAVKDGCKRLLFPSVEREIWANLLEVAHTKSIDIFAMNLEKLLLQPPLSKKMILGFDPAFRTGCKLAVIDNTGKLINIDVIYPHPPQNKYEEAAIKFLNMLKKYDIEIIAIGNGTASRESEKFVADVIKQNNLDIKYTVVSEAGASVYSASEIARNEFPDLQVEQRSAISIGRRILDPLSELIKIDPKSIGVGQYQHDLPQKKLSEQLDFVVMKSVNRVGVDINTASCELLMNVSGLNKASAKEIVNFRNKHGRFTNREQIKEVKKIGDKAFQQCAGFLRIKEGSNKLDETSIHPESYAIAEEIMKHYQFQSLDEVKDINAKDLSMINCDEYTINDIVDCLMMPLRDYREEFDGPLLRSDLLDISDLKKGDKLEGVVRNVVDFGAFVDIGIHDDGLVHISKMSKNRVKHPSDIISVGDIVDVWVYDIDKERNKVQLTLLKEISA
ncbi:MAG: Tex family protein [Anaerorhabdus sp.]